MNTDTICENVIHTRQKYKIVLIEKDGDGYVLLYLRDYLKTMVPNYIAFPLLTKNDYI